MLHSAITAPGSTINEDAYGLWPNARAPLAAWVLDGVTGINERALLPGPTDAFWFVAQTQAVLQSSLVELSERPIDELVGRLADELSARQIAAWLSPDGASGHESPAASFGLFRQMGVVVEIAMNGTGVTVMDLEKRVIRSNEAKVAIDGKITTPPGAAAAPAAFPAMSMRGTMSMKVAAN